MFIPLLARRRTRNTDTRLYTGGDTTIDVSTKVDISNGVAIFGRRDSNVLSGFVFGTDDSLAYRMGAGFTQWGSASYYRSISGLTITAGNLNMTTAFPWNESAYPVEGYATWSIGGSQADVVTWTGSDAGTAISHSLGQTPGAAFIVQSSAGVPQFVSIYGGRAGYSFDDGAWVNHGGTPMSFTSTQMTPASAGVFDESPRQYTAVIFPEAGSQVASGEASGGSAENIGWQPRTLMFIGHNDGEFRVWDATRDGTGLGDNSGDYSTVLSGSTAIDSAGDIQALSSTGFTLVAGQQYSYIAIR